MNKKEAKEKIKILIDKYEAAKASSGLRSYTEEDTKNGYIMPLFEALGWDFSNKEEVSAEESMSAGRVDYGFYLNGRIKFYLEAKKLSADLHNEDFANQAVRYSWNRGATWAILTDFESIMVFNAQDIKRSLADKLYFEIPYDQYLERFEQLWLLSKKSFENDSLDKDAEAHGKKFQKIPVTSLLYEDLEKCRDMLTKDLGRMNDKVSSDLLDEGVQKLLDRLIFIRVAEDRGVEDKILTPLIREARLGDGGGKFYESMVKKFREFDDIYNSNLFSPHPFEQWDDYNFVTEKVINILYGKQGYYEYDFKVMPADVLGAVYESYLGHRLTKSKRGLTVAKDAGKRKEHGIYYTPSFIVDYIVKNALGPVLDSCRSVHDLKKIKVLDPACGSGSFLIKAFNMIAEKYKSFGAPDNEMVKIQILEENIYGVDLDPQAVEITRLNLLINSLNERMKLPFLNNIKNGNSLLMEWKEEFPNVSELGGFNVIIGNPPYIKEFINKNAFDGLRNSPYYQGKMDIWTMFACVSMDLLKEGGILSFIAPNNWVSNAGASLFRDKILKDGELESFVDFGDYKIFKGAGIQTMVLVFKKRRPNKRYNIDYLKINDKNIEEDKLISDLFGKKTKINLELGKLIGKNITFGSSAMNLILDKIQGRKNFELIDKEVGQGIVAAPDKYFLEKRADFYTEKERYFLKNFYTASGRYRGANSDNYIFYICDKNFGDKKIKDYPNIERHFRPFEEILRKAKIRYGTPEKRYFYLHREREERFFVDGPKIVCGVRVKYPSFYYTDKQYYGSRALNFIKTNRINLKYLTGILNSNVVFFWLKNKGKQLGSLLQIDKGPLLNTPIFIGDRDQQKQIINLVDKITKLNDAMKKIQENSNKWISIKSEIEKTDKKIDQLVYKFYGLTPEEIKIAENS